MTIFSIATGGKNEIVDVTDKIEAFTKGRGNGIVTVFVKHTTCAITTADLDEGTDKDYIKALSEIAPKLNYNHPHDPSHFNEHLLSSIIGTSISVPVEDGKLLLGTWQKIILIELSEPREREIVVSFKKED